MKKKFKDSEVPSGNFLRQLFFIMKLTLFFLMTSALGLFATGSYSQNTRVTLDLKSVTVKEALKAIENESEFFFIYNNELINVDRKIDINVKDQKISDILSKLFDGENVEITVIDRKIVLAPASMSAQQAGKKVSGKVTDSAGATLPGVSVVVKGTTIGVITDNNGNFSLGNVPENAILQFSFVGMMLQEFVVGNKTAINVILEEETVGIEEVVAIGYGTQKKKDLTGSVGSVGNNEIKDMAVTRIEQALSGKVAGVQVKSVSGEPGVGPQIRIRGIGSISAGAGPLYVVDGFPTDNIQTLNPNDIETMDILKDASATAIYGSRGSNGVVIINTKRGKAGKTIMSFDTYYGLQKVLKIPKMKNSQEQAHYGYDGYMNANIDMGNSVSGAPSTWKIPVPAPILDVLAGTNTYDSEALNEILRTAPIKQYQLTATGGSEKIKFAVSGEYEKTEGIVINSDFERYSLRANIDIKLTERLLLKININPSFNVKRALPGYTGGEGNLIGSALGTFNWIPLLDSNGGYTNLHGRSDLSEINNPLAVARETIVAQKYLRFLQNINAEYKILDGLNLNVMFGTNIMATKGMRFVPQLPVLLNVPALGTDNASLITNWLSEYTLNYNKSFNKHNITALVGYTAQKERDESNTLQSNKYPNNLVPTLSAVSGQITNGSSDTYEWSLVSYLARVNYNYNNKYYLTTSIRADGSSRFGSENKYALFPSVALSWRVKEETFLKQIQFLNELKIRASFGKSGNNNIGNYESYATINYEKYVLGNGAIGGFAQGKLENSVLTWEKQQQINLGFDAAFFLQGRVRLSVDHFISKNNNLLLSVNIPSITGFSNSLQNIGEVSNKGWEFVLSSVNLKNKFRWTTDFNLSTYKNKVVKLGPTGDPIYTANNITMIGQPIGMFYGLKLDGIFMNQSELNKGPIWNPGAADRSRVGDMRFVDINGDGIISSADYTTIGTPYPDFYYGMTNNFTYKDFTLSINIQGSQGSQIYCFSRSQGNSGRGRLRGYAFNNDYWKSEQDPGDGKTQRPNNAPTGGARAIGQQFLDDGSFLRVNNISMSYLLPEKISHRLSFSSLRVYINATNPILITKYASFNPDVSISENPLTPGNEQNDYPIAKGLVIGLNVGF